MKRLLLNVFGFLLILVGIIGWLIPILPGWPLMLLGLSMIAPAFTARLKRRLLRKFSKQAVICLQHWRKLGVHAGFTTRHFELILRHADELSELSNQDKLKKFLSENSTLLSHQVLLGQRFIYLNQVHGNKIAILDESFPLSEDIYYRLPETDGVLTNRQDLNLLVMTADCLSIFYSAGTGKDHWIGLVHAGWRGTQKEIAKHAFRMIQEKSQCDPSQIRVLFGPRIGKDCYEVGPDFKRQFSDAPPSTLISKNDKLCFDLAGENRRQLIEAGARSHCIEDLDICTVSENEDYYSFRKEKESAGRIISFIKKF